MNIFKTDVRQVLKAVRVGNKRKAFEDLIMTDPDYRSVDRESAIAIRTFTGMDLNIPSGKEINVCKAVEEMKRDWTEKGRTEGRAEGKAEGILITLSDMVQSGDITPARAVERAKEYGYTDINTIEDIHSRIANKNAEG